MLKTTSARLFGTLLGYVILIILLLTLNPFYFTRPEEIAFDFYTGRNNLINNILLFVPAGFLYRPATKKRGAFLFGAAISLSIEIAQFFIPARTPSIPDILANAIGAGLGAGLYDLLSARMAISQGILGRLRLETPLMGLIYLCVPLLWINMLALDEAPYRWLLTLLLGICGAIIFSSLFRHWWKSIDWRIVCSASLASGAWFFIGVGPTLLPSFPIWMIGIGLMLFTGMLTLIPQSSLDRRFERKTLRLLLPAFALYLVLLTLFFPIRPLGTWHVIFGFTDRVADTSLQFLYPRVEHLAAFTVLGYMIAEWRGRLELPFRADLPRMLLITTSFALGLELLSGFQGGASFVRLVLSVVGSLFGGTMYHMSREHIRFLLGR